MRGRCVTPHTMLLCLFLNIVYAVLVFLSYGNRKHSETAS